MILDFCVACGEKEATKLENHHLVPRSAGGSDEPSNLITLCFDCHGKAHGYQRRDIRKLVKAGVAAAKKNGKKPGNPGMRNRDPEAIRKISAARDAGYLAQLKATADHWLPVVQQMRPKRTWDEVVDALNAGEGQTWRVSKLRRAVGRFVAEGLADPILLKTAPQARNRIPRMPSKAAPALQAVASLVKENPAINIPDLANKLQKMGVPKPGGTTRWCKPSTAKFVEWARSLGML